MEAILDQLCVDASDELRNVDEWMKANRLSLNVEKTCFMLFTHAQVDRNTVSISLGNRNISQVRSTKFLGIQIDDKLNYNDHISILSKKLSCTIGTMRRISPLVPPSILKTIFVLFSADLRYNYMGGNVGKETSIE